MLRLMMIVGILLLAACHTEPYRGEAIRAASPAEDGAMCGGIAGITCGEGSYCAMETGQCQMPDAAGTCRPKPEMCTMIYAPVCGCDGKTYASSCMAAGAGVSVAQDGECGSRE